MCSLCLFVNAVLQPEKLSGSEAVKKALMRLYERGLLSRFIIDEVSVR
jgi:hypothetical protein